jgi:hypothetical protein
MPVVYLYLYESVETEAVGVCIRIAICALVAAVIQPVLAQTDVLDAKGCVVDAAFESQWRKLSDFETPGGPLESRSLPVQQYEAAQKEIRNIEMEIAGILAHMELDREARLAARDLEKSLTQGLKANLLRAFWRLAWITFNTIGGPTGKTEMIKAGRSYAELFSEKISVASTAKMLGVVKKLVPKQYSKLPGNEGRVVNVGVDALLEGLKNSEKSRLELVASVVTKVLDTGVKEVLDAKAMKPDITPEEIAILRTQYLDQQRLQQAIAESYRLNAERQTRIEALEAQAREAAAKAAESEQLEKHRVYALANQNCRKTPALQFGLSAPQQVIAGEIAEIRAILPPGRTEDEFMFAWAYSGELLLKESSLEATFQSTEVGPHPLSVSFIDKQEFRNLGTLNTVIQVIAPPPKAAPAAASSGPVQVRIARLDINPASLKPGDVVEFEVHYGVSGVPEGKQAPISIRFAGRRSGPENAETFDETSQGMVVNGEYTGRYGFATPRWSPGRYEVHVSVLMPPAVDFADGSFVIRQPDVAVRRAPAPVLAPMPAPGLRPTTQARDFIGDWEGEGMVLSSSGIEGLNPGERVPVRFRITYEAGAYRVYDLLDPDTPTAPLDSRIEGDSVVFYYQGPMVDTQGYEHPDMPMAASWRLTLIGNDLRGDAVSAVNDIRMTIRVQAQRTR